jgi:hypothetical protein
LNAYNDNAKKWKQDADKFAKYYLTCFRPEQLIYNAKNAPTEEQYTWHAFCDWITKMEASQRLIDRLRLATMYTYYYGQQTNDEHKQLFHEYRMRNRTIWSEKEQDEIKACYKGAIGERTAAMTNALDETQDDLENVYFSNYQRTELLKDLQYCNNQKHSMDSIFGKTIEKTADVSSIQVNNEEEMNCIDTETNSDSFYEDPEGLKKRTRYLRSSEKDQSIQKATNVRKENLPIHLEPITITENDLNENNDFHLPLHEMNQQVEFNVEEYIDSRGLSTSQETIVRKMAAYFEQLGKPHARNTINTPTALNLLLTGDPGSGKSFVIETICELAQLMMAGTVACSSYNGIAAVNIDGITLLKLLGIGNNTKSKDLLSDENLIRIREALNANMLVLLIIDEISTIDAQLVALIHSRLQQILKSKESLGGLSVLFVGDFNQLGPVKKVSLQEDMMK